jgi:predicted RNA-binding Zn ribbon-like protein
MVIIGKVKKAVPKPFQLYGGHPAVDLVNTLDMRFTGENIELLPTYAELLRFAAQAEVLTTEQVRSLARTVSPAKADQVLAAARELREALAAVLYAWSGGSRPPAAQVAILERHFQAAAQHRKLRMEGTHLHWAWSGTGSTDPELPLWKLAQAASDLLTSNLADSVKGCGDPSCRWLFLDVSKNHTRRWCDMKTCGNRMKARRFQARRQESSVIN